jgi:hypothetical protein
MSLSRVFRSLKIFIKVSYFQAITIIFFAKNTVMISISRIFLDITLNRNSGKIMSVQSKVVNG